MTCRNLLNLVLHIYLIFNLLCLHLRVVYHARIDGIIVYQQLLIHTYLIIKSVKTIDM